jgi:Leucine-rich repeat (LRR) protein
MGGLNAIIRLANNCIRCKRVVESCTTKLTNHQREDGPESLPIPIIQTCRRIEEIRCSSENLVSLVGCPDACPDGLKRLYIGGAPHLSDLSPLASCSVMEHLWIGESSITDISVVASMPLLEEFACCKMVYGSPSIKDLSPLASCLRQIWLYGPLSPLSSCTALENLSTNACSLVSSLAPLSGLNLIKLYCARCPLIASLSSLSNLMNLQYINCSECPLITSLTPLLTLKILKVLSFRGIDPQTSLLPVVSCIGLKVLVCIHNAVDLEELGRRTPHLEIR